MSKALILTVVTVAICVGCKRLGFDPESSDASAVGPDGQTAAQYNLKIIAGYAWPLVLMGLRLIPGVGPAIQAAVANVSWAALATKQQKEADKA